MKRNDLWGSVCNVLERCGSPKCTVVDLIGELASKENDEKLMHWAEHAAAVAFARNLTEDDDTRRLRWQYGDLYWKGHFTLED